MNVLHVKSSIYYNNLGSTHGLAELFTLLSGSLEYPVLTFIGKGYFYDLIVKSLSQRPLLFLFPLIIIFTIP